MINPNMVGGCSLRIQWQEDVVSVNELHATPSNLLDYEIRQSAVLCKCGRFLFKNLWVLINSRDPCLLMPASERGIPPTKFTTLAELSLYPVFCRFVLKVGNLFFKDRFFSLCLLYF